MKDPDEQLQAAVVDLCAEEVYRQKVAGSFRLKLVLPAQRTTSGPSPRVVDRRGERSGSVEADWIGGAS